MEYCVALFQQVLVELVLQSQWKELIQLGCHTFLRVGTCGGMRLDVQKVEIL